MKSITEYLTSPVKNINENTSDISDNTNIQHEYSPENSSTMSYPPQFEILKIDRMARFITTQDLPDNKQTDVSISDNGGHTENDNTKRNAFQFMMSSRNKSIGMNSPGKVIMEEVSEELKSNKETLAAKRNLLNAWAEQKGASKRKREEELDETIRYKLNKRSRRLKTLLNVDDSIVVQGQGVLERQNRKNLHFSSSSGSDSDTKVMKSKKTRQRNKKNNTSKKPYKVAQKKKFKKENLRYTVRSSKLEEKVVGEAYLATSTSSSVVIGENSENNVLSDPKSKESRQSIPSFFGVTPRNPHKHSDTHKQMYVPQILQKAVLNEYDLKKYREGTVINRNNQVEIHSDEKLGSVFLGEDSQKVFTKLCEVKKNKSTEIMNNESHQRLRTWKIKINSGDNIKKSNANDLINRAEEISSPMNKSTQKDHIENHINISSDSDDDCIEMNSRNPVKLAPMFIKLTPKPKEDPKVIEARKQFLKSGIPVLKKVVAKEQSHEEREIVVFPTISHIQQKSSNIFWDLSFPNLNLRKLSPFKINISDLKFRNLTKSSVIQKLTIQTEIEKVYNPELLLNKIKMDNPNYPVYKFYRIISEKCGKSSELQKKKTFPKRGGGRRKQNKRSEESKTTSVQNENNNIEFSMWTDKYKPKCADDIIGNTEAVRNLKKWLVTWMNFSQEINSRKRRNDSNDCSESEFETADGDSTDSMELPGNTIVLGGPCGSGKSTAVYAICSELNFNIIELNASSKRTGKKLLQRIQEATRSHQVRKGETRNFQILFENVTNGNSKTIRHKIEKKMVVILIEDIDIVFEQDEGFISALTDLITTSKRPIILTTTNYNSVFVQRFLGQYKYIPFLSLTSYFLSTWLQILCIVEGIYIDNNELGNLLDFNEGDVRKTLLELQFWVKSGGQIDKTKVPLKIGHERSSCEEQLVEDEQVHCLDFPGGNNEADGFFIHRNCIKSFAIFEFQKPLNIPYHFNLGMIWWNIPSILDIPGYSKERVDKLKLGTNEEKVSEIKQQITETDKNKLKCLTALYDSLSQTDVTFRKVNYPDTGEPIIRNYHHTLSDSLELEGSYDLFDGNLEFAHELSHNLVNRYVKLYNRIDGYESRLNMSAPDRTERRWRAKQQKCEEAFRDPISISNSLDKKSLSLDYIPALRNISRTEFVRAANNTKRGKRFRNYLRDLGFNNYYDNVVNLACNILKD